MMADDADPSDWLAGQFGEDAPEQPTRRRRGRSAEEPPPAAPSGSPPAGASGSGFAWGLTPSTSSPEPTPAEPSAEQPPAAWDVPTVATPVQRDPEPVIPPDPAPTVAFTGTELTRQEFPGFGAPVDESIEGVTEVLGAHPVGHAAPDDEGPEVSALDSLFGDTKFVEYEDALIPALPPRASGGELVVAERPRAVASERASITRNQKILMAVAGGIVAVLLLVVLFLAGSRLAQNSPPPVADPSPSASALPTVGPLPAGEYRWDELLGGECITPFTSPWADTFTVVPCTQEHQAQLVLTGTLPADPAVDDSVYPGADALQARVAALCAALTVIDYAAVGGLADVQLLGSFAADEQQWLDGDRSFSCFAIRAGGATFTTSIQPAA